MFDALATLELYLTLEQCRTVAEQIFDGADSDEQKRLAIYTLVDNSIDDVVECSFDYHGLTLFDVGSSEYAIGDDDEVEDAVDSALENYLDECVEGADGPYFDREAWKRDARVDGAGYTLSRYDGNEIDAGEFRIFRVN